MREGTLLFGAIGREGGGGGGERVLSFSGYHVGVFVTICVSIKVDFIDAALKATFTLH